MEKLSLFGHDDPPSSRSIFVNGPIIVGAGISGLATAACLRDHGMSFVVLERADCIASLWRKRSYDHLKLHLPKNFPHLPKNPSKRCFVEFFELYENHFQIKPRYNVCFQSARFDRTSDLWRVKTVSGGAEVEYISLWLVVATGEDAERVVPEIDGLDEFAGEILHACDYKSGERYKGQKVLVVGCGNSGMEVSLDLCKHNASPAVVVPSPIHVLPKEILSKSMFELVLLLLAWLPLWIVDKLLLIMAWFVLGNMGKYGIKRPEIGPLELKHVHGKTPVVDFGALKKIRAGQITVVPGIKRFSVGQVELVDGRRLDVDSVVLATGCRSNVPSWLQIDGLNILHACDYKSGEKLDGYEVFVFGCGTYFGKKCEGQKFIQAFSKFVISFLSFRHLRKKSKVLLKNRITPPRKDLPPDIVRLIGGKLVTLDDFLHFSQVCKSWRDGLTAQTYHAPTPFIMAAEEVDELRVFTEFLEHRQVRIYYSFSVPSIRGQCWWSSHVGYLVCWDREMRRVRLVNPIFSDAINLAPVPLFVLDVTKGIITSHPRLGRAVVILLYEARHKGHSKMIFTRSYDKTWNVLGNVIDWDDVVEWEGSYFGCSVCGEVYRLTFGDAPSAVLLIAAPPVLEDVNLRSYLAQVSKFYVVSSGNELLLVQRYYTRVEEYFLTCYFRAWVIDITGGVLSIAENIGDRCIIVGRNTSYSIRYSHNNHEQRNLVVYTDDFKEQYDMTYGSDLGIFDLGTKRVVWTVAPAFSDEQQQLYSLMSPSVLLIPMS